MSDFDTCLCGHWRSDHYEGNECHLCRCPEFELDY